ncbi:MAG TPA: chemotaxis protein CheW [Verrucomicrobiae bacterium]|nr:chemotaxis protein CheW [Verrucomicrobiae bacterium]
MLFLIFQLGGVRYAVEANRVAEVLPLLDITPLPQAPKGVAGIFNLRGRAVPALDLSELTSGKPARERLTTRIIVINHLDALGQSRPLGLIAESVTQMLRKDPGEFVSSGVKLGSASYLGPVLLEAPGPIHWLRAEHLVTEPIRQLLCSEAGPATPPQSGCLALGARADGLPLEEPKRIGL